jgi:hypothetical protein
MSRAVEIIVLAVFLIAIVVLAFIANDDKCPECGGTLMLWGYDKMKCKRDGRQDVQHKIY